MTNVKPPLTPPLRVTKNHPPFFTQKTLSEELQNITPNKNILKVL